MTVTGGRIDGPRTPTRRTSPEGPTRFVLDGLGLVGLAFLGAPLVGLVLRGPLTRLPEILSQPAVLAALRLSLVVSLGAVAVSLLLGVPLAWMLSRGALAGGRFIRSLVLVPMVLPPVVGGVALFAAFGRRGFLGPALASLGISLPFSTSAAVVAAAFVAMPFLVVSVEAALSSVDRRLEDAAATMGASRMTILRTITLPAVGPALGAGAALCWARALGEFGATIMFAGNLEGVTQTIPLAVYTRLPIDPDGALALSLVLLAVALGVIVVLRGRIRGV